MTDQTVAEQSKRVSFHLWHKTLGGHVHVRVFSSEFGVETTHGLNGTLIFRLSEWPQFKQALELSRYAYGPYEGPMFEFVDETEAVTTE